MNQWFIHAVIAVMAIGGMQALYKVPSVKGHDKFLYSFLSFAVATILSFIFFKESIQFDSRTILFGLLWGSGYAFVTLLQMEILKKLDTNTSFPITSLSSHVLVVILGITFFNDKLSLLQILAILLTFIVVGFYNQSNKHITFKNGLLPIAAAIVFFSTFNKFIQKFGSISSEVNNFIFWQLFFAMLAAVVLLLIPKTKEGSKRLDLSKDMIGWAVLLGAFNFIGTAEIVRALSTGPFSLVYTINSFYILIASLIAWKFFGEKLTKQKITFLLLAIFTLILIKLG